MNDKSTLLDQLKIDRSAPSGGGSPWRWWAAGVGVVAIVAVVAFVMFAGPSGIPVHVAMARAVSSESDAGGGASLLDASGYVVAQLQAAVSGKSIYKVNEILIEEGQHVKKDQIIARLDDSNVRAALSQAKAQVRASDAGLAAAKIAYANAQPIFARNQRLVSAGWISQDAFEVSKAAYDAAEAGLEVAKQQLEVARGGLDVAERLEDDTIVRAPFDGVVTVKSAQPGQIVSPQFQGGGGIATIVDMNSLEVEVDVSENFISRVRSHQPATIKLNAYPDWQIPGEVISVIPTADRAKATVKVRIAFKQKDDRVVPEMGARVSFLSDPTSAEGKTASRRPAGVIVPLETIQSENGANGTAFVVKDGRAERRTVSLGARNQDGQTVLTGLTAGERIVVGDVSQLSDGAKVKIEP